MNEEEESGSGSVANTTDQLSRQLDKISSRKSSLAGCTASTLHTDPSYLGKLTSAYHQANALRKTQSKSKSKSRNLYLGATRTAGGLCTTTTIAPIGLKKQNSNLMPNC